VQEFHRLTGARAERVLYFGDHIMNDLVQPARAAQWRTVAIISEIKHELDQQHTPEYADLTRQLLVCNAMPRK
jgi:FMN phosphatase YigB (HAD superfamily)